jgi:hypothetical protein
MRSSGLLARQGRDCDRYHHLGRIISLSPGDVKKPIEGGYTNPVLFIAIPLSRSMINRLICIKSRSLQPRVANQEYAGAVMRRRQPNQAIDEKPNAGLTVQKPPTLPTWGSTGYFVITRRGPDGMGVCCAGEITNVTHVFQPSGRFSWANSL